MIPAALRSLGPRVQALRQPIDLSTTDGRARERHRRVVLSAIASASAKMITIGTSLISVPLTLHYLGTEQYGMWMLLSSFSMMLSFADMGLGNGILNAVAYEHGRGGRAAIREVISSGYAMLSMISVLILIGFVIAYPFVPWYRVFNASSPAARAAAGPALAVFVTCFALAIPLNVVQKVQIGLQQGFRNSMWQALSSVMALISVLAVIRVHGSLAMLVLGLVGAPLIAGAINSASFFKGQGRDVFPVPRFISLPVMRRTASAGLLFFVVQFIGSIKYGADTLILVQLKGAMIVAQYAVPERLFAFISMLVAMVMAPLWPAYREAISRGDAVWVRRTVKRSLAIAALSSGTMSVALVIAGPLIIRHWVGSAVQPTLLLLLGLGVWRVIEATGNASAYYMNGAGLMLSQAWIAGGTAVGMIGLKIFLIEQLGPAGIPWGAAISFASLSIIPSLLVIRKQLTRGVAGQ